MNAYQDIPFYRYNLYYGRFRSFGGNNLECTRFSKTYARRGLEMNLYQEFWRWWYADNYSAYLSSWRWRFKRLLVIWTDGGSCVICHSRHQLQVHHRTYKRIFCEPFHHLTTVCATCHSLISRNQKRKFSLESLESIQYFEVS